MESALMAMPALAEGLRRGVATIQVEADAAFWVSAREKVPTLRDLRQT
jgi:indoleacetate--lysine synthetase